MIGDEAIAAFLKEADELWIPSRIEHISCHDINPLTFYRNYVSKSVPVILTDLIQHWPALNNWRSNEYFPNNVQVPIEWTPNGRADSIYHKMNVFTLPEQRLMDLRDFLSQLGQVPNDSLGVPYLSHQNDNLRQQLPSLLSDIDPQLPLAVEAFRNAPEAVNLWIGDQRSVSSLHKDHYENMYCVVTGEKRFTLLPPCAIAYLNEREYPTATFTTRKDTLSEYPGWGLQLETDTTTPWIDISPDELETKGIECLVKEGQVLYLPALWYHQVAQSGRTIAVNYWHDMEYDCRYLYYNLLHHSSNR